MPRKPSCLCGACRKCKKRAYMKGWYRGLSGDKKLAHLASHSKEQRRLRESASRRANQDYLVKHRARNAVYRAIKRGELVRQDCERRGDDCFGVIQAHHADYSKPLDVQWLCAGHHAEEPATV